jgi:hypothetical protein
MFKRPRSPSLNPKHRYGVKLEDEEVAPKRVQLADAAATPSSSDTEELPPQLAAMLDDANTPDSSDLFATMPGLAVPQEEYPPPKWRRVEVDSKWKRQCLWQHEDGSLCEKLVNDTKQMIDRHWRTHTPARPNLHLPLDSLP